MDLQARLEQNRIKVRTRVEVKAVEIVIVAFRKRSLTFLVSIMLRVVAPLESPVVLNTKQDRPAPVLLPLLLLPRPLLR
jgi:hypothetical protein